MKRSELIQRLEQAGLTVENIKNDPRKYLVRKSGQIIASFLAGVKLERSDLDFIRRSIANGLKQFLSVQKGGGSSIPLVHDTRRNNIKDPTQHHRDNSAVKSAKAQNTAMNQGRSAR